MGAGGERDVSALTFEEHRAHLRAVAYRMLGSLSDAEDAVQEAWIRLHRSDTSEIANLGAWLTVVVARISLNMLRARANRREEPLRVHLPDPVLGPAAGPAGARSSSVDPEQEVLLADSVGLALMVVLDTLSPAERLAFVLHDLFAVPFENVALLLERTPAAARQLASRARRRVQAASIQPDADLPSQHAVVEAFFAAARGGDLQALVSVLHPDVVLRADLGAAVVGTPATAVGASAVAARAARFAAPDRRVTHVTVNGAAGAVITAERHPVAVMAFTVTGGKVRILDVFGDPARLRDLELIP